MLGLRRQKNIAKNQSGATAIEFALIAPLFFAFILGIMDIAVYFFVSGQLQHGVVQAARGIRTGNIAGQVIDPLDGTAREVFRTAVCNEIVTGMMGTCTSTVRVDVRSYNTFASIDVPSITQMDTGGNSDGFVDDGETVYNTGGPSCPVFVRAFFKHGTIIPGLEKLFAGVVPGTIYLTAATVFRNEPFTGGIGTSCATAGDLE
mgnify:CR=1 FL=1